MKDSESVYSLNLEKPDGRTYYHSSRPWEEEVIYFVLPDRFHDGRDRIVSRQGDRSLGYGSGSQLERACGGTLKGITLHLDYIQEMGCTSIWLGPVFQNNPESYHGYAIENFLQIDTRFGTKKELEDLISEAHRRDMKVFLDCVLNHSGNNWSYRYSKDCFYDKGKTFPFGSWRGERIPMPIELRDLSLYKKKGMIRHWDTYPETREGDFFSLKKFNHDETDQGLRLQEILFRIYAYWLRETDCDGFRMDAVKHLGELPLARFSARIRAYAKKLGKEDFFIFAEAPGTDDLLTSFLQPAHSGKEGTWYTGPDTCLDFPLHFLLPRVVLGKEPVSHIFKRYWSWREHCSTSGKTFLPLVTFLDNHDQIEKPLKERVGSVMTDEQLIAALGLLLTLPGVPCLYYGTEQGFRGHGPGDSFVREAMFDPEGKECAHNKESVLYKALAVLARIRKNNQPLLRGDLTELICEGSTDTGLQRSLLSFSRRLGDDEVYVFYNASPTATAHFLLKAGRDGRLRRDLEFLYGGTGRLPLSASVDDGEVFKIEIPALKFLILK